MAKKNKKRQRSRTVELKRQMEQEKLAEEKDRAKKRMNPVARALLLIDLVFLSVVSLLDINEIISDVISGACTLVGVAMLLIALWLQFGPKGRGSGGPKL
jgi:hypothetical protein